MIPISRPSLPPLDRYKELLEDIWQSRMLSNFGKYASRFEEKAQAYLRNPWTRSVANCDVGLTLSVAALGLEEGSECLVQSFTFNSTINAILWNRLRPVFVDIDPRTLNVDVQDLQRRITPATRAILVTHIFGSPLPIDQVLDVAKRSELRVVVDAAHAYGATYRGSRIGEPHLGDFQVFSFSGTKQITSAEGGLVAVGRNQDVSRLEHLRAYGFQNDYISKFVGMNAKLSELHAALGCLVLDDVEDVVSARGQKAARYRAALEVVPGLQFQEVASWARSTYKDFAILCPDKRDELSRHLEAEGIQTKKYFRPLHNMPAYMSYRSAGDDLADTEAIAGSVLCLPMFNELSATDIDRVSESISAFYGQR